MRHFITSLAILTATLFTSCEKPTEQDFFDGAIKPITGTAEVEVDVVFVEGDITPTIDSTLYFYEVFIYNTENTSSKGSTLIEAFNDWSESNPRYHFYFNLEGEFAYASFTAKDIALRLMDKDNNPYVIHINTYPYTLTDCDHIVEISRHIYNPEVDF